MEIYKVRPGDNLTKIGARFGISMVEMLKANKQLRDPNFLLPGQMVNVPTVARHASTDPSAQGPTVGDFHGGTAIGAPAEDPKYIQNIVVAVEFQSGEVRSTCIGKW